MNSNHPWNHWFHWGLDAVFATLFTDPDSLRKEASIVVTENTPKDALNEVRAIQFAPDNSCELHWYHARDFRHGKEIVDETLRKLIYSFDSGRMNPRQGRIPLCIGMPVLVSQSFDVKHGIVNGTRGTVKTVRYTANLREERRLTSCIIEVDGNTGTAMMGRTRCRSCATK